LDVRPPQQQESPLQQYGNLLQLQNLRNEQPLRQQILQQTAQQGALDVQQKQIDLKDQQALTTAMQQWGQKPQEAPQQGAPTSLPNYDDLIDLAKKNGASFKAIQGLQNTVLGLKEKASTIAKDDA